MPYLRLIVRFMGITNIEFVYTAATSRKGAFMLEEPLEVGTNEEDQVTAIISHVVRPGREQGYEEWLRGIIAAAKKFKGQRGVSIVRPCDHTHPEYVAILRFDRYTNLKQ